MGRSCINLVGNTTVGQNVGTGINVYAGKSGTGTLQFKSLSVTGTSMSITCDDNNIYLSAQTGGGGSISGTPNVIPTFNSGGDGLQDTTLIFTGKTLCNSDCLTIQTADGCKLYLNSFSNTSNAGSVSLGTSSTPSNITEQRICTDGQATDIALRIYTKGSGDFSIRGQCTVIFSDFGGSSCSFCFLPSLQRMYVPVNSTIFAANGGINVDGCPMRINGANAYNGGTASAASGGDVCVCGGFSFNSLNTNPIDGGNVVLHGGVGACGGSVGRIRMDNLPAKTSETCGLYIDVSGNLSTGIIDGGGGTPGGSNTHVQYNSNGSFAGSTNFTFDGTNVDVAGSVCAADFELTSDIRCKTNIVTYAPVLADIQYKEFELCNCLGQTRYGVIAQEIQKIYPEVVRTNEDGYLSISYIDLLVREIAYLKNKVEELENKIG